jgi:hypothetical protein
MTERRRLLLLVAFLLGTAVLALTVSSLVTGSPGAALMPAAQAWGVGALVGLACHGTRSNFAFAGAALAVAGLYFLAPYLVHALR